MGDHHLGPAGSLDSVSYLRKESNQQRIIANWCRTLYWWAHILRYYLGIEGGSGKVSLHPGNPKGWRKEFTSRPILIEWNFSFTARGTGQKQPWTWSRNAADHFLSILLDFFLVNGPLSQMLARASSKWTGPYTYRSTLLLDALSSKPATPIFCQVHGPGTYAGQTG